MRRYIGLLFFSCIASQVQATELHGRIGGFLPQSHLFREMYGTVVPSYQIEASWKVAEHLKVWQNTTYSNVGGHSVPLKTGAHLQMLPLSLGLTYLFFLPQCVEFSVGAGACYTWLRETNHSGYIPRSNHVNGYGGVIKTLLTKKKGWFEIALFADYFLQGGVAHHSTGKTHVDLSGLAFGLGIGGSY